MPVSHEPPQNRPGKHPNPALTRINFMHRNFLAAALLGCVFVLPTAMAHDTWFAALPSLRPGDVNLLLGTGDRYPLQQYSPGVAGLAQQGCRPGSGPVTVLKPLRETRTAVLLQSKLEGAGAITCWAQLSLRFAINW